ncbi:hypothetical protein [Desulfogranum marinum]|nr:hypothetical protein [Desulfogranum marinum]
MLNDSINVGCTRLIDFGKRVTVAVDFTHPIIKVEESWLKHVGSIK